MQGRAVIAHAMCARGRAGGARCARTASPLLMLMEDCHLVSMSITIRSYFWAVHAATASSAVFTCLCMIWEGTCPQCEHARAQTTASQLVAGADGVTGDGATALRIGLLGGTSKGCTGRRRTHGSSPP